jgi:hypothetical protein
MPIVIARGKGYIAVMKIIINTDQPDAIEDISVVLMDAATGCP